MSAVCLVLSCPDCDFRTEIDGEDLEEELEGGMACCPECQTPLRVEGEE